MKIENVEPEGKVQAEASPSVWTEASELVAKLGDGTPAPELVDANLQATEP